MAQQFKEIGHPNFHSHQCFESRNVETKEWQMYHSLQWRFHEQRCFISNNSFCESSQYLHGCYELVLQICFEEGKQEHVPTPVDNRITTVVEAKELDMFMSSPNLAQGNLMMGMKQIFRVLGKKGSHDLHFVKKPYSNIMSQQEVAAKFDQMEKADGDKSHLCREYTSSRAFPQAKPLGTISAGTIMGPISEVLVVKILDECGVEVAIPSICKPGDVTYVVISRETERDVNEIHTDEQKNQIQWGIARKSSRIQRKHVLQTKRGNHQP